MTRVVSEMGLRWPPTLREIEGWKVEKKKKTISEWAEQQVQGIGIKVFGNNPEANCWLTRALLRPGEEIDLLRMRSNVFPTRTYQNRQDSETSRRCRRCHEKDESLAHVLGECPYGK